MSQFVSYHWTGLNLRDALSRYFRDVIVLKKRALVLVVILDACSRWIAVWHTHIDHAEHLVGVGCPKMTERSRRFRIPIKEPSMPSELFGAVAFSAAFASSIVRSAV